MNEVKYKTKAAVLARGCEAIGIPLKEMDVTNRLGTGKGAVGSVLEESWFGYSINSKTEPDFPEAGVELKATPYRHTRNGIRAKERLVCNVINYVKEHDKTFYTGSFWHKCSTILIMSYEHRDGVPKGEFTIDKATLFSFPEEDLVIIEDDWNKIVSKIKAGKAHEISESDTLYLGACTKGASAASAAKQPFSDLMAKTRAFSLKSSYMTYVLNNYIFGDKVDERVITDPASLTEQSFEEYILTKIKPHFGKSQAQLFAEFSITSVIAKNCNELLLSRMLGLRGRISKTAEFQKANIIPKTVRVNADGSIKESMSFPSFDFKMLITEDWEDSELKNMFEQTKFLFVVFRFDGDGRLFFDSVRFWNIPEKDLEEVKVVWERTVSLLKEGLELRPSGKRIFNNLPKARENRVAHVRPHARNAMDTLELPDGRRLAKQCFWLNNTYIREQLEK